MFYQHRRKNLEIIGSIPEGSLCSVKLVFVKVWLPNRPIQEEDELRGTFLIYFESIIYKNIIKRGPLQPSSPYSF